MIILNGKEVSEIENNKTAFFCDKFFNLKKRLPTLAVVLIGSDPASVTYVKGKKKACNAIGIKHVDFDFETINERNLRELVDKLNKNDEIDGILIQLPVSGFNDDFITSLINPEKDVDGFNAYNIGKMFIGNTAFLPCTPKGILHILDYYKISTEHKNVCIIGRSNIVGKPMAGLLMQKDRNATVTICHSGTPNLKEHLLISDIIISAAGSVNLIDASMIKKGCTIIDVGMNRIPDSSKKNGYRLVGDVNFESVKDKVYAITPVPGGVGPMTISMLMRNTVNAAFLRNYQFLPEHKYKWK